MNNLFWLTEAQTERMHLCSQRAMAGHASMIVAS